MSQRTVDHLREEVQALKRRIERNGHNFAGEAKGRLAGIRIRTGNRLHEAGGYAIGVARERPVMVALAAAAIGALVALLFFRDRR